EPTTLNETEPCACSTSDGVRSSPNSGTPRACAAAFAPSACQSSFGSVVTAPAAVVTLLSASDAPETPSESVGARPTSSAERRGGALRAGRAAGDVQRGRAAGVQDQLRRHALAERGDAQLVRGRVGAERVPVELRVGRRRPGRRGDAVDRERAAGDAELEERVEPEEVRADARRL